MPCEAKVARHPRVNTVHLYPSTSVRGLVSPLQGHGRYRETYNLSNLHSLLALSDPREQAMTTKRVNAFDLRKRSIVTTQRTQHKRAVLVQYLGHRLYPAFLIAQLSNTQYSFMTPKTKSLRPVAEVTNATISVTTCVTHTNPGLLSGITLRQHVLQSTNFDHIKGATIATYVSTIATCVPAIATRVLTIATCVPWDQDYSHSTRDRSQVCVGATMNDSGLKALHVILLRGSL